MRLSMPSSGASADATDAELPPLPTALLKRLDLLEHVDPFRLRRSSVCALLAEHCSDLADGTPAAATATLADVAHRLRTADALGALYDAAERDGRDAFILSLYDDPATGIDEQGMDAHFQSAAAQDWVVDADNVVPSDDDDDDDPRRDHPLWPWYVRAFRSELRTALERTPPDPAQLTELAAVALHEDDYPSYAELLRRLKSCARSQDVATLREWIAEDHYGVDRRGTVFDGALEEAVGEEAVA